MQDKQTNARKAYSPALSSPNWGDHNAKQDWKTWEQEQGTAIL